MTSAAIVTGAGAELRLLPENLDEPPKGTGSARSCAARAQRHRDAGTAASQAQVQAGSLAARILGSLRQ